MHRLAVKSNLVDSGSETTKLGLGDNELPLCPKPRRLGSATSEILKPLRCNKHSQPNMDGRSGVVSMITEKTMCCGCLASDYSGSPPGRTHNPLVHDVQFMHQMEILSSLTRSNQAL
ncbi:hypothetical protein AAG906_015730 [Vitis piasezkii]|uniref:uncharacterized protein LOC117913667 n=1 Tax=Vitis riparia TaxID=96939 RepID=UPI00155A3C63|nr:uncharacterized protein LOC117913667 [Vitis riparia]